MNVYSRPVVTGVVAILVGLVVLLSVGENVRGTTYDVSPGQTIYLSFSAVSGQEIRWDWHTTNLNYGLDFWVEDAAGTKYSYQKNIQSWTNSFTVPSSGTWHVDWYNSYLITTVTVEYTVSLYTPPGGGGGGGGGSSVVIDWGGVAILSVIAIIIVAVVVALFAVSKKPQPPPAVSSLPLPSPSLCSRCNYPLVWVEQYQRWYCSKCGQYA
jgi:hypothetical protein